MAKGLSYLSIDPDDFDLHHVFPAIASLGLLLGDTRGFDPRAGGAGIGFDDAIGAAMGELLERYASFAYNPLGRIVSSHKTMSSGGHQVVPFEMLTLFSADQLPTQGFPYTRFTEETPVGWFEGTNLLDGSSIYVPGQLVSLGYVAGADEISSCFYSTSSGCALATSAEGALLGALLECIERDAVMIRWYARLAPPRLDLDPGDLLRRPLRRQSYGLEIRFHDMTVDLKEVPVVGVTCVERSGRPCFFMLGTAASVDSFNAARKALVEAAQGRPFAKLLANLSDSPRETDVFNDFDLNVRFFAEPSNARYVEWFFQNATVSGRFIPTPKQVKTPAEEFNALLDRCSAMKVTPIGFDLSTPEMRDHGLFVCRVFVPELVPLCVPAAPFLGHPRLERFIEAAEHEGLAASLPAWVPHPFP